MKNIRTRAQSSLTRPVSVFQPAEPSANMSRKARRAQMARIKRWEKKYGAAAALLD